MGEFFQGWRRKAGLVTLAMACWLARRWGRHTWCVETLTGNEMTEQWDAPDWHIVLPLTLLSAWLILGKTKRINGRCDE